MKKLEDLNFDIKEHYEGNFPYLNLMVAFHKKKRKNKPFTDRAIQLMNRMHEKNKEKILERAVDEFISALLDIPKKHSYQLERPNSFRQDVLQRDNYTCQKCGVGRVESYKKLNEDLHIHHVKPISRRPELAFEEDNVITLCRRCHKETSSWGRG